MIQTMRNEVDGVHPPLVHCSAGIGRTGTVIAIDHALQLLKTAGRVNLLDVVFNLRKGRCAMIQHVQQYLFFHAACVQYAKIRNHPVDIVRVLIVFIFNMLIFINIINPI